jgi:hypothetical protein
MLGHRHMGVIINSEIDKAAAPEENGSFPLCVYM